MPVELIHLRNLLLPGLWQISIKEEGAIIERQWQSPFTPAAPHIWVPKLTIPQAIVVGAAATVIKNPEITRRFWSGWNS